MISLHDYLTRGSDCALLYLNMLTGFFFKTLKLEVIHAHLLLSALAISDNSVIQVMQPTLVFTKQWNTHIGKWTCDILTCNFLAFIFEAYNDDLLIAVVVDCLILPELNAQMSFLIKIWCLTQEPSQFLIWANFCLIICPLVFEKKTKLRQIRQ